MFNDGITINIKKETPSSAENGAFIQTVVD